MDKWDNESEAKAMKVLLLNGSPNQQGCTATALAEVGKGLQREGVDSEFFQLGAGAVQGCIGCGACAKEKRCVYSDDEANVLIDAIVKADGLVVGSPVYYAGPNGALCALLDRTFYAGSRLFASKPAAAIASCRRAGSSATLDRLMKYFTISRMPVVSSQYWAMVHGNEPKEVLQDAEGMQTMRDLGANMAWMLKGLQQPMPQPEKRMWTNFIR